MKSTLFTNVKLKGQDSLQDLYIVDGKFKEIGPGLAAKVKADKVVDLEGKLAVPPYVDPHIHLDSPLSIRQPPTKPALYLKASNAGLKPKATLPKKKSKNAPARP